MKNYLFALILIVTLILTLSPVFGDEYLIKPGDTLSVTVLGEPDLTKKTIVSSEGNVTLPLVNEVKVSGKTMLQAADELTNQFKKFIKNPQITVELAESAKIQITVLGEVQKSGVLVIQAGSRLADAITAAGGYTPTADLSRIKVSHAGETTTTQTVDLNKFLIAGDASANILISQGDTIAVPTIEPLTSGKVMVLGAVKQAGSHPLTPGMTLREAVMMAGGPTELADLTNVTLRHESDTDSTKIDFTTAAVGNPAMNPLLKPGDVIFVTAKEMLGYYTIQGAVASPGKYELKGKTSITEAIAIAGGIRDRAKLNSVQILRASEGTPHSMSANVSNILSGKAPNIDVQNGDNIVVPEGKSKMDMLRIASFAISLAWLLKN